MLHRTLDNGVEVVVKENRFSHMLAIQCWVGAGSIHESEHEFGMAHCIEHMLFKGTETHKVGEIAAKVEAYGGDINAYTTFDHTVYYLTLNSCHARQGVDILADAIFNSHFDQQELGREKEVILEEIRRSLDNPGHRLGRHIFEDVYRGSAAARPIIGYAETVESFEREDLLAYFKRWYQPANMKVVVVGDFDTKEMFEWVEQAFGQAAGKPVPELDLKLAFEPLTDARVHLIRAGYEQPRLEIAFRGPPLEDQATVDLDLAAFALGSGESSRLNRRLRDNERVASTVGASLYSPHFGGIFELSAIPLVDQYLNCARALGRELGRLLYKDPVSPEELERAQTNLRADQLYQEETVAGEARALGYGLLTSHKTAYDAVYAARVGASTGETIHNSLHRWLDLDKPILVGLLPDQVDVTEDQVRDAYFEGLGEARKPPIDRYRTVAASTAKSKDTEIFHKPLADGIDFVYRQHTQGGLFNLIAVTEGGLRSETEQNAGQSHCFAQLLASATRTHTNEQLNQYVEGRGAVLGGFSGKDSLGLKLQCFDENARELTQLWADCLLDPVFPETRWHNTQQEIQEDIRQEKDSPSGSAIRSFQENIYAQHPYRFPSYGLWSAVQGWDEASLQKAYAAYRDAGPWVIGGVGRLAPEEAFRMLQDSLGDWRPAATKRHLPGHESLVQPPEQKTITLIKDREQTHLIQGTLGLVWHDPRRPALDVLSTIMGGSGGRLFVNLRDRDSLAYSVTPILSYGCHQGVFGAYLACAPTKVEQALTGLRREFDALIQQPVSEVELERAKNYLIGGHESEMQRSDAQTMTMALMQAYGVGYEDFLRYSEAVRQVKPNELRQLADELLKPDHLITVLVGPQND
jgi:zinc protease